MEQRYTVTPDRRNPWREGIGPPVLGGRTGTEDMQE